MNHIVIDTYLMLLNIHQQAVEKNLVCIYDQIEI